ncbi:MAG: type III polyketide synthase, partial [Microscillaceae bacterium]|nr:type III polyketide synthase [Microscillaceae bacterium]
LPKSARSQGHVIVGVELCTLHLQKSALEDDLIANSLFGDGAGAVLLSAHPQGQKNLCLSNFASSLLPQGKTEMAWHIHDAGFSMRLSTYVPHLLEGAIAPMIGQMLNQIELPLSAIDQFAIHPGGRKILEAIEKGLHISKAQNHLAYEVLRDYGNMSSVTILFVWKKLWQEIQKAQHQQHILSMAFGPGLAIEASLMQVYAPGRNLEFMREKEKLAI